MQTQVCQSAEAAVLLGLHFCRNVPAQPYGDVDMGDGSDANNVDRAAVAPGNNNEATDGVDNRRLRSSTRKRHVEVCLQPGFAALTMKQLLNASSS